MLVVVEVRQLYKNSHATEELESEPKRRKVAGGETMNRQNNFSQKVLLNSETHKISEIDVVTLDYKKDTFDTEMDTTGTEADIIDTVMVLPETKKTIESNECSCGYLHGAGQGFHHDKTATGLGVPLLRGPE